MSTPWEDMVAAFEAFLAKAPKRIRRTSIPLQDEVTSEEVRIVSDDLTVKAKPAREGTDGNQ